MKNLSSLLARLGALSLAATVIFSTSNAATQRKDQKAAAAVIEALVHHTAGDARALTTDAAVTVNPLVSNDSFDLDLFIGSQQEPHNLAVNGNVAVMGDGVTTGMLNASGDITSGQPQLGYAGLKHLIGIQQLDPRTQQFKVVFKDKTKQSLGAFVELDFVTTVTTSAPAGLKDLGKSVAEVIVEKFYCHPQMDVQLLNEKMTGDNMESYIYNGINAFDHCYDECEVAAIFGEPNWAPEVTSTTCSVSTESSVFDMLLTPTGRIEAITRDVCIGFVPRGFVTTDPSSADGFYDSNWAATHTDGYPIYGLGTLSYQVASSAVAGVSVVTSTSDELAPLDVFELFTDEELQELLFALNSYFGNDSVKMREYLMTHRHALSRAFKALRS